MLPRADRRRGQRQTAMHERPHQDEAEAEVEEEGDKGDQHRCFRVLEGVKSRHQHPDQGNQREPEGIVKKGRPAFDRLGEIERPTHEEEGKDRRGTDHEPRHGRYGDEQGQLEAEGERLLQFIHLSGRRLPAHGGEHRLGHGDGEYPLGEFEESLGVVEVGDAPLGKERGEDSCRP